jgi:lysophospholipase L1-like esterase
MALVFVVLPFLLALEILLGTWVRLPAVIWAGGGLAAAGLILRVFVQDSSRRWVDGVALAALWVGSLMIWLAAIFGGVAGDSYYSSMAGILAAAVWVASGRASGELGKRRWNGQVAAWLLFAAINWLAEGYIWNRTGLFYGGLAATLVVLFLIRLGFRWRAFSLQLFNLLIMLLIGLPVADLAVRLPASSSLGPENCRRYYSFDAAQGDPGAFHTWEEYYSSQFGQLGLEVFMPDPKGAAPFLLRPGARGKLVGCPISINSLGFRGPEFSVDKHGAYRIVALGESTTFGMTIQPGDTPWPQMLEEMIRQRLKTDRPVQVINAGVPAYSIKHNADRLARDILPLRPDMIISYHGANGFNMLDKSLLPSAGHIPPVYEPRPLKLAADLEHRLRMKAFQREAARRLARAAPVTQKPSDSPYAAQYRRLIEAAKTNGIRLVLANFSMAVNTNSDPRVIDFYQGGGARAAYGFMRANEAHSRLARALVQEHPEILFADTHPYLDGEHEKFIDLIHFTDAGRRQLAENMFGAIQPELARELEKAPIPTNSSNPRR